MNTKTIGKRILGRLTRHVLPQPAVPLAVLTYHSIGTGATGSQPAERFRSQLQWLRERPERFFVSHRDFAIPVHQNRTRVVLTFDDGYLDNWEGARPILDEFGFKALFFVTTSFIEGDQSVTRNFRNYRDLPPMTWDHIGALAEQGHVIGLHGDRHANFRSLSREEAVEELQRSAEKLLGQTGLRATIFAYPFGLPKHQRDDLDTVFVDLGLRFAFTSIHTRADAKAIERDSGYRYRVPRLRIDPGDSIGVFAEKVNGYWDFVAYVQRVFSNAPRWVNGSVRSV